MGITIKEFVGYNFEQEVKSMAKCGSAKKTTKKTTTKKKK